MQSIHISAEMWGAVFCLVIGIITFVTYRFRGIKKHNMAAFDFAVAILLLMDSFAWLFRGNVSEFGMVATRVSNFAVIAISAFLPALLASIIESNYADKTEFPLNTLLFAMYMIGLTAVICLVLNIWTGAFYSFDEGNYFHRGSIYIVFFILSGASMIICTVLVFQCRKLMEKIEYWSLLCFMGFPAVAVIIQSIIYGAQLINLAIGLFTIMFFFSFEISNEKQHSKKVEELAIKEKTVAQQEKIIAKQELEMANLQQNIMLSQIQPHFLYNSLTAIAMLCEKDPKMAKNSTITFAQYLRANMNALKSKEPVSFEMELEHIKNYMKLEKMRFGDELNVIYDIETVDFDVPVLGIQPMVENAVKHGIKRKGTVWLSTREVEGGFEVEVKDNGVGFDTSKGPEDDGRTHVGIENVTDRLHKMVNGTLKIDSKIGEGTVVTIFIPNNREY